MQKSSTQKKVLVSLLVASTLLVSGCNHSSLATPVTKTQTKLKHSFTTEHIATAVTNAAQENGWQVIQPSPTHDSKSLLLKKTFTKKITAENTRGRIWNKITVNKEIFANVAITEKSYEVSLTEGSKTFFSNYNAKKQLKNDLHRLENSISVELLHDIL